MAVHGHLPATPHSALQIQLRAAGQDRSAAEARAVALEEFRKAETKWADDLAATLEATNRTVSELRALSLEVKREQPDAGIV